MNNSSSKGKEIKIPGPDHPITISPTESKVRVTVAGRIVAESMRVLRLEEKGYPPVYYLPRRDADTSLLVPDNALHLLSVQGRLHVLQHSHWRNEIGICRLDLRKPL
jgi:uncharacterized protein (DUF427 family)